jgi:hypothetical protein
MALLTQAKTRQELDEQGSIPLTVSAPIRRIASTRSSGMPCR